MNGRSWLYRDVGGGFVPFLVFLTPHSFFLFFRNTIAPEISLYNARILYQWNIALDSGSIRTKVDPTSAIQVTWTDKSTTGKWITDVRIPLVGTTLSSLSADVRVRRQFCF
jgi:hypothetical protein